ASRESRRGPGAPVARARWTGSPWISRLPWSGSEPAARRCPWAHYPGRRKGRAKAWVLCRGRFVILARRRRLQAGGIGPSGSVRLLGVTPGDFVGSPFRRASFTALASRSARAEPDSLKCAAAFAYAQPGRDQRSGAKPPGRGTEHRAASGAGRANVGPPLAL